MQNRFTKAALSGKKVATGALFTQEYLEEHEPVESPGEHQVLLGPGQLAVAVVEITRVETYQFKDVPWEFADDEGEDFTSIEHWREGHRSFYADEGVAVSDDAAFVCVWFRVLRDP
jgi:uncharacterized protein YhfF